MLLWKFITCRVYNSLLLVSVPSQMKAPPPNSISIAFLYDSFERLLTYARNCRAMSVYHTQYCRNFYPRSQDCGKWLLASPCMDVRPCPSEWNNSAPTERIFHKIWNFGIIFFFFRKIYREYSIFFTIWQKKRVHDDICALKIVSRWIPLRMGNVSD